MSIKPEQVDFVIYHSGCPDGIGSAMSAKQLLGDKAQYYPAYNRRKPPDNINGKIVAICDFSYSSSIIQSLIKICKGLIIIDHHESAEHELKDIPREYKLFDIKHSAAYLSWKFFNKDKPVPNVIKYIEDRDIWTGRYVESTYLSAYLSSMPDNNISIYESLLDEKILESALEEGKVLQRAIDKQILLQLNANILMCNINNVMYIVAYKQTNIHISETGNRLLQEYKFIDFSICYYYSDIYKYTHFSLRSNNDRADVSHIASILGGGGLRNSSALKMSGYHNKLNVLHYDIKNLLELMTSCYNRIILKSNSIILKSERHQRLFCEYISTKTKKNSIVWSYINKIYYIYIWIYNNKINKFIIDIKSALIILNIKHVIDFYHGKPLLVIRTSQLPSFII